MISASKVDVTWGVVSSWRVHLHRWITPSICALVIQIVVVIKIVFIEIIRIRTLIRTPRDRRDRPTPCSSRHLCIPQTMLLLLLVSFVMLTIKSLFPLPLLTLQYHTRSEDSQSDLLLLLIRQQSLNKAQQRTRDYRSFRLFRYKRLIGIQRLNLIHHWITGWPRVLLRQRQVV